MKISTKSTLNRGLLKMTTTAMTSFLWMFLLTSSMTLEGTGAQWERTLRPPPPPSSQSNQLNPTWPAVKPTAGADAEGRGGDPFKGWPWWWWIPAAAAAALVVFTNCVLCVWCCCKRRRRNSDPNPEEQDDMETNTPPTNFRRMESSAAKRYLHNIASVFSWGSDFDGDQTAPSRRPSGNVIYANTGQRGTVMYANPQTLGIPNSGGPPRRKSSQHYRNID